MATSHDRHCCASSGQQVAQDLPGVRAYSPLIRIQHTIAEKK